MAQAIHCDAEGHRDAEADVLVSQTANGDTTAWCFSHYVDVCRAVVETAEATIREARAADDAALARLDQVSPGPDDEPDDEPSDEPGSGVVSAPDLAVATFRPPGDQPDQEALGGPETGDQGEPGPESAPDPAAAPGAPVDAPA